VSLYEALRELIYSAERQADYHDDLEEFNEADDLRTAIEIVEKFKDML